MKNQPISKAELDQIRAFSDFDLTMFVSELHDFGWPVARWTLCLMPGGAGAESDAGRRRRAAAAAWDRAIRPRRVADIPGEFDIIEGERQFPDSEYDRDDIP